MNGKRKKDLQVINLPAPAPLPQRNCGNWRIYFYIKYKVQTYMEHIRQKKQNKTPRQNPTYLTMKVKRKKDLQVIKLPAPAPTTKNSREEG